MESGTIDPTEPTPAVAEARSATGARPFSRPIARSRGRRAVTTERRAARKIRFTASEWSMVEERARACGRTPARYVREIALGTIPKVSRTRANAPFIRELGALTLALQRVSQSLAGTVGRVAVERSGGDEMGHATALAGVAGEIDTVAGGLLAIVRRMGR